jgi:DNA-binding MarR family transcriptional regulator
MQTDPGPSDKALQVLMDFSTHIVTTGDIDLSNRQMAILLAIYLEQPPHTVRGLAERLNVTKPVITRALDSMSELGLVGRKIDNKDKRNTVIMRTTQGRVFLDRIGDIFNAKLRAPRG